MDPRIILLVTQVIIESLPISSSGHLRLAEMLLDRAGIALGTLPKFFEHFLNGPALVVLAVYFYKPWSALVRSAWRALRALAAAGLSDEARRAKTDGRRVRTDWNIRAGLLLLKIIGLVLASELAMLAWMFVFGRGLKMYENLPLLAGGFVLTGLVLASERWAGRQSYLSFPRRRESRLLDKAKHNLSWVPACAGTTVSRKSCGQQWALAQGLRKVLAGWFVMKPSGLTFPKAILLGLLQGFVYGMPGLSRFACTVIAARWLGLSPRRAFEFSFMIFVPLVLGAFCINGLPAVLADPHAASFFTLPWLVAYVGSTACAYVLFAGVARLALTGRLWRFAWYMPVPVAVTLWLWMW